MYIDRLYYKNVGPIDTLDYEFKKTREGLPIPTIIVGKNGSGKSILLSNIVDAFYEIAGKYYTNATENEGIGHQFYKEISPIQIKFGQDHMVSHIHFTQDNEKFEYIFKSGNINFDEYKKMYNSDLKNELNWNEEYNYKFVTANINIVENIFQKDIICFFSPYRYMKPNWMGNKYFIEMKTVDKFSSLPKYNKYLNNPITALNISDLTLQWLFDIIADSRGDIIKDNTGYKLHNINPRELDLLNISRKNVEQLMSEILGKGITFRMNPRYSGKSRFSIHNKPNSEIIAPTLDALSTGELSLFNMFATIIRYADNENIILSFNLQDISGIVVIEEIELHLHPQLQYEILPKLIKLFPKIQFIITTHSPLFLLGMRDVFGEDNIDILEMPSGYKISTEEYSEFKNAYNYFKDTNSYKNELINEINKKEKNLIITEGATDWKHLKAAYNALKNDVRCKDWINELDFEFLEYVSKDQQDSDLPYIEMGNKELKNVCQHYSYTPRDNKIIFIADCDDSTIVKDFDENHNYKSWDNNVYSFCLPIPEYRKENPKISIEHLYKDTDLKKEIECSDGKLRRIFLGNEFDAKGRYIESNEFTCNEHSHCGFDKIRIVNKVFSTNRNDETNYALSKMVFADHISNHSENIDFSGFIPVFERIRDILSE